MCRSKNEPARQWPAWGNVIRRNFLKGAAASGIAFCGCGLLNTGHRSPDPRETYPVDHVFTTTTLSDKQKIAILGGNAARLFGMKEA